MQKKQQKSLIMNIEKLHVLRGDCRREIKYTYKCTWVHVDVSFVMGKERKGEGVCSFDVDECVHVWSAAVDGAMSKCMSKGRYEKRSCHNEAAQLHFAAKWQVWTESRRAHRQKNRQQVCQAIGFPFLLRFLHFLRFFSCTSVSSPQLPLFTDLLLWQAADCRLPFTLCANMLVYGLLMSQPCGSLLLVIAAVALQSHLPELHCAALLAESMAQDF